MSLNYEAKQCNKYYQLQFLFDNIRSALIAEIFEQMDEFSPQCNSSVSKGAIRYKEMNVMGEESG